MTERKMTDEEKKAKMIERNAAICAYYKDHKLAEVCSRFKLGRQRVMQILQTAGAWRPYVKGNRTKFLGITVSEETKNRLHEMAEAQGTSASKLASDALDEAVR